MARNATKVQANPNESNEQPIVPVERLDLVIPGVDAPEDPLLSISDAADAFEVTRQTIYNWIAAKSLPALRTPGGLQKVRRSHIAAIIGVARSVP